jgi:hypothetical protein
MIFILGSGIVWVFAMLQTFRRDVASKDGLVSMGGGSLRSFQYLGPPLWSSGQSSWLQIHRFRVRFPVLPDFLRSGGSGTGSTQLRSYLEEIVADPV